MTEPYIYLDGDDAEEAIKNNEVCKVIGTHVTKTYPDRVWFVEVIDKGRVCRIRCPSISMEYGMEFVIMERVDLNCKKAALMAGEILERFNLTRGRTDNSDMYELNRTIKGVVGAKEGDISANTPKIVDLQGRPFGVSNA